MFFRRSRAVRTENIKPAEKVRRTTLLAGSHPEDWRHNNSAPPQQTWTLKIDSLQAADGECRIQRLSDDSEGSRFEITAVAQSGSKRWTIRQTLVLRPDSSGR
ncbi:MAG TPA: hypothetical protein PLP49_00940 [Anaerohalosphaeraceae bacterium]|nr:hypothetical protein [Anaerohalosphaeraceae bacterium]